MIIFIILLLILLALTFVFRSNVYYRPVGFPPGPTQLPLVGNLLFFRKSPLKALMTWKREYGNIVGVRLGQSRVVVISDYNMIKEALNNLAFNARPNFKPALLFSGGENHGTLTSAGDSWDIIRRFTIKNLNQLNFGREGMESFMQEDISRLIIELKKEDGKLVDFKDKFYLPIINHLWIILMGIEIPGNKRSDFQNALVKLNRSLWKPVGSAIWFMPWLTELLPSITGLTRLKETLPVVQSLVKDRFKEHISDGHNDSETKPGDLMSAFLAEMDKALDDSTSPFYKQNGFNHMEGTILNLFVTAAETLTNILNWSLLYLSLYPEVQEKFHQEILEVIGSNRMPSLNDQTNMPYTKVVMQELLRISSTSPFANFHETVKDVQFHGYFIPKGTVVIASLYGIHHDQEIWGDPECFRPERFLPQDLQQNNNNIINNKSPTNINVPPVIPFSVGLRTCIGQTFAKKEIFMLLVSLCQQFEFSWDPNVPKPSPEELTLQSHVSIFRFTMPFKLVVTKRPNM